MKEPSEISQKYCDEISQKGNINRKRHHMIFYPDL